MITALIIANIALTIGAMYMVKETKKMNKSIEDLGLNLAHIQRNELEMNNNITSSKKDIIEEFKIVHKKAIAYPSPLVFLRSK
ncbi:hypothetical protein SDC9_155095 [bioreactor metagenome]|uniref:Uncharacterized protein n=1 Tax=bioreactor metagenome TaxID=1076179 RepID=A0A645F5J8_9ZZZZ